MNKGWECPKCGGCYAPTVAKCETCVAADAVGKPLPAYWRFMPWQPPYYVGDFPPSPYPGTIWGLTTDHTNVDGVA